MKFNFFSLGHTGGGFFLTGISQKKITPVEEAYCPGVTATFFGQFQLFQRLLPHLFGDLVQRPSRCILTYNRE